MAPVLGYWDVRGFAQPIRLLLHYLGIEFEDKLYSCGPAPDFSKACWREKEQYSLGLDFPNLPYYIDGDTRLSQSSAILRHIARKNDMCGQTDKEKDMVDLLELQLVDLRELFVQICYYAKNLEEEKQQYLKDIVPWIKGFADFLGEKKFFVGDKITYVDFMIYDCLDQHKVFESSLLEPYANLKAFLKRIEELPAIAEYMKSDKFIDRPFWNKRAKFR